MEVHSHAHSQGNKWVSRLWEFFMLFLAVTLGFFVENQREHMVEHKREKQFIRSFCNDLRMDIRELDSLIRKRVTRKTQIDSLIFILESPDPDLYGGQLYYFARYLPRPYLYIPNDATLQQLKNSGNLRLIRKQTVVDTILGYDRQFRFMETIRIREDQLILRVFDLFDELFDPAVFDKMNVLDIEFVRPEGNPHLLNKDRKLLQRFLSEVHYLKTVNFGEIGWFSRQKQKAEITLAFLEKEYGLK